MIPPPASSKPGHTSQNPARVASVVVGVASGGIWLRNWNLRGMFGALARRTAGRGAVPAVSGLMAGAAWRAMCVASRLMPRDADSRWLAEAESFLFEAPPAQQRRALRNYLVTAPQVIAVSWAGHLARRIRAVGGAVTGRRSDAAGDPAVDTGQDAPPPSGARRTARWPVIRAGAGVLSEGMAGYLHPVLGEALAAADVIVPLAVGLILLAAILRGSSETCERAFRLLRWITDRPEPPAQLRSRVMQQVAEPSRRLPLRQK